MCTVKGSPTASPAHRGLHEHAGAVNGDMTVRIAQDVEDLARGGGDRPLDFKSFRMCRLSHGARAHPQRRPARLFTGQPLWDRPGGSAAVGVAAVGLPQPTEPGTNVCR